MTKLSLIALLSFCTFFAVLAQNTGSITGAVSDKKTGETIIGAAVRVVGTSRGIATDVNGRYAISGLAVGTYVLEISYLGYSTKRITDIAVTESAATPLNVVLEEAGGTNLETVVITATARQESVNTLYALQKNSVTISDGISAELIRKSPDRNTSDVLKRVSGTTIQDNKFVVVRGLSDRYNTALLD
ncbi:MAG: TonB-dependent receptor, partial [Chitinophagaceae bacterium]